MPGKHFSHIFSNVEILKLCNMISEVFRGAEKVYFQAKFSGAIHHKYSFLFNISDNQTKVIIGTAVAVGTVVAGLAYLYKRNAKETIPTN